MTRVTDQCDGTVRSDRGRKHTRPWWWLSHLTFSHRSGVRDRRCCKGGNDSCKSL